ncbi:hypothetical protein POP72_033 [Pectobacterium phage POP72]|uniref:Uncharacterized protein n=2 Tax=Axomammavirus PP1 TaxID=2733578 RepID=I7F4Y7_9CAUD|nr:hypothetical protein F486_gp28 [Pectobacterium phage PP1]AFP33691.1 hypothetical protein PP1_028 [Pectobacterium phage PP1]ARB10949.1 hypothetical protein POP72_033 [Pectobacterium phage POP72]
MTKTKPTINQAGMDMLENMILKPAPAKQGKGHDELVWDEAKRYILACIYQQFQVQQ